ncbi:hypothetical protein L917_13342 [Phytophthora nicotianae]|uniref:Uncharacterized protein n=1 Tax=Phytophthora nicotianae TaxID=4792 RepID=W2KQI7_PHYNI|nr:hypothetical protein L917_13342 [Phytophthora nicotianae]
MLVVQGPRSINENKFPEWSTELVALESAVFDSLALKLFERLKSDAAERYPGIDARLTALIIHMLKVKSLLQYEGAPKRPHPGSGGAAMNNQPGAILRHALIHDDNLMKSTN